MPFIFSLPILINGSLAFAQDTQNIVHLGLVGQWNNDYGVFNAVKVLKGTEFKDHDDPNAILALCATSEGLLIINIDRSSMASFIPLGYCQDLEIERANNGDTLYVYVVGANDGLYIIRADDPKKPFYVAQCYLPGSAHGVDIYGNYAYVACEEAGIQVIDISNPKCPKVIGTCDTPGSARCMVISQNAKYAYVADWMAGLQVININNPTRPYIVGNCDTLSSAGYVAIDPDGAYAYIASEWSGLQAIDISNPKRPKVIGICNTPGSAGCVAISGEYAYVADGMYGIQVIDISNPDDPYIIKAFDIPHSEPAAPTSLSIDKKGEYAYVIYDLEGFRCGLQKIKISNPEEPYSVKVFDNTPGEAYAVAIGEEGKYAYVADWTSGLQVIDISSPNGLYNVGSCITPDYAGDVAIEGEYAYVVTKNSLQIINISNPMEPYVKGNWVSTGNDEGVAIDITDDYACIAYQFSGIQIINIKDPSEPYIEGNCDTPGRASDVVIRGSYLYVADGPNGIQVINISDPGEPYIEGNCDTPGYADGIDLCDNYAYIFEYDGSIQVIDISDPGNPNIIRSLNMPDLVIKDGDCLIGRKGVVIDKKGEYAYMGSWINGLEKHKINFGPSQKGNLILVAGGAAGAENTLWPATEAQANYVFNKFMNAGYEIYDIWYQNPVFFQDTDGDGAMNQLVVDDNTPTKEEFQVDAIDWAIEAANTGPLCICLIGHGAEDRFQIMPGQVITANELRHCIERFQDDTNRQVVVIIESAASGTFINDLINDNNNDITIVTSTGDGSSYIKPVFINSNTLYNSFTTVFIDVLAPNLDTDKIPENFPCIINELLNEAFIYTRNQLESWAHKGPPFADQASQMASSKDIFSSLNFSNDTKTPLEDLFIRQNIPCKLAIIGQDPNNTYIPLSNDNIANHISFFSSNTDMLDPNEDMQTTTDPNGIFWYTLTPNKNGRCTLIAHIDSPTNHPNLHLSAKLNVEVAVDDPGFFRDKERMAIIAAGYKGTGDYLFDSTNTIANHAYKTLLAMGYTKEEIYYYNPYFLQDLDNNEKFDEIDGYPKIDIFDSNAAPDTFPLAELNLSGGRIGELFLFLVDHGGKGTYCLNPTESLTSYYLIDQIEAIADKVDDKIIFLYDACHSGSFLSEIEKREAEDPNYILSKKLITISSTDPNQTAYYLNKGIISFAYPFFDEWFLTHSLTAALDYAKGSLLGDQTPQVSDPDLAAQWDQNSIYFVDESRPFIDEVQASRINGTLYISAYVFSLTGIDQVWAVVEDDQKTVTSAYGQAITEALEFSLSSDPDDGYSNPFEGYYKLYPPVPDPCPNETSYLITIYAKDKSKRSKTAFYKTAIGNPIQNRTKALIIASAPNFFQGSAHGEDEELKAQVKRAEAILEYKGLVKTDKNFEHGDLITISGEDIDSLDELPVISSLAEDQTLFVYLIGKVELRGDTTPYFRINQTLALDPNEFSARMPQDPNQRLLILMDAPYADRYLERIDPDRQHKNWARIASTDQDYLFFTIKDIKDQEKLFPCFSSFFFRMVLSGATVAQTFRMAQNAVSITRQGPDLFLPEDIQDYQTIARHLNYHLGWFHGEDSSLLLDCKALAEDANYTLSFTTPPDANITRVWAVLAASPAADVHQELYIVDFDTNDAAHSVSETLYQTEISSGQKYYKAHFHVEGQMEGDDAGKNIPEWREVPVIYSNSEEIIGDDEFEAGEDPNSPIAILFDPNPNREIFANAPPTRRTFYCEECEPGGMCTDCDWMYFYAREGHIYDIYAQDLSAKYFIQIALYDPNMYLIPQDPNKPDGPFLIDEDFLTFMCKESGYYLVETRLVSSYPSGGVEYILSVTDPQAGEKVPSIVYVIDPCTARLFDLSVRIKIDDKYYIMPCISEFVYPDTYLFYFNDSEPHDKVTIEVYDKSGVIQDPNEVDFMESSTNEKTIVLPGDDCDPNRWHPPELTYEEWANNWKIIIDPNANPFPEGDNDPNLPREGDYEGDGIINFMEYHLATSPINHTVSLPLYKGVNIYYLPEIYEVNPIVTPGTVLLKPYYAYDQDKDAWYYCDPNKHFQKICYYYDPNENIWVEESNCSVFSLGLVMHTFNAIKAEIGGEFYLSLLDTLSPILYLKGFSCPWSCDGINSSHCCGEELFNPDEFTHGKEIKKVLTNIGQIETISCPNEKTGRVNSTYRFFGKSASDNLNVKPGAIYIIYKKADAL
ncbi:MAG: C13 family peptidase [bacterium]